MAGAPVKMGGQLSLSAWYLPFSLSSGDLGERSQENKGCTPRYWPNHCTDTPAACCWMHVAGCHHLHGLTCTGKPQLLLLLLISESFIFSASLIGLACANNTYVKYRKALDIHFSSVWILSLCVLLRKHKPNNQGYLTRQSIHTPNNTNDNVPLC